MERISNCSCDKEALKLIYQWIKQDEITPKEFKELLSIYVYKEGKK